MISRDSVPLSLLKNRNLSDHTPVVAYPNGRSQANAHNDAIRFVF